MPEDNGKKKNGLSTPKKVLAWAAAIAAVLGLFGVSNFTEFFTNKALAQEVKKQKDYVEKQVEIQAQRAVEDVKIHAELNANQKAQQTTMEMLTVIIGQQAGGSVMSQQVQVLSSRLTDLTKENNEQRVKINELEAELKTCRLKE